MTKIKCNKYQQPIIGTSSLATCDCDACAIPTRKDQEKLREQVTKALIYRQNKEIDNQMIKDHNNKKARDRRAGKKL